MSVSTIDETIIDTIKIELENIACDSPPLNKKTELNPPHDTDSNISLNENSNSDFSDDDINFFNNQLKCFKRIKDSSLNGEFPSERTVEEESIPPLVENLLAEGKCQEQISTISSDIERKAAGIRYFKDIGRSDGDENENGEVDDLFLKASSGPELVNTELIPPALPSPRAATSPGPKAGSSNDSSIPTYKSLPYKDPNYGKVDLYAPETGPSIYNVKGNIISKPIIVKNLSKAFDLLPVHGRPENKEDLKEFYEQKIRDYVGYGITDSEFQKYQEIFNLEYLKTGYEFEAQSCYPSQRPVSHDLKPTDEEDGPGQNLCTVKKLKLRVLKDPQNHYPRKLKYRGLRMIPLFAVDESNVTKKDLQVARSTTDDTSPLEPGKDLILRLRVYRPHSYGGKDHKSTRHSVFNNDVVVLGRQRLTALRDRLVCANDVGMRVDVSDCPDSFPTQSAKQMFPSGFLFINNVFYVDRRPGCRDMSAGVRDWARKRGLGDFPVRDMASVRCDELRLRLGHPEVYLHQGKCEHLFTFSEVRLMTPTDPVHLSSYPCFTQISQNQSVYCTTCAEFGAKWLVVGCNRVPFDPAFFCDTCFRLYLYDGEGKKIGEFKAYAYGGNTVNFMRPIVDYPIVEGQLCDNGEDSRSSQDVTLGFHI